MKMLKIVLAASLLVGSVKAMAEQSGDNELTRVAAVQIEQIEDVKAQVDDLISKVGDRGAALQENSLGQISFIIDSYVAEANSTDDLEKINTLWTESQELGHEVQVIKARLNVK